MIFSVMKCHRCGRIFVHFGKKKAMHCTNHSCHTMITRSKDTEYVPEFTWCQPYDLPIEDRKEKAFVYISAFNNVVEITVAVFSTDGGYAIFIPVDTDKLPITTLDLFKSIPKHLWETDPITNKIIIQSGLYCINQILQDKLTGSDPV